MSEEEVKKEESEIANLPFPHARVKELIKNKLNEGTYIKKKAAINLNLWLGKLADQVAEEISQTEKAYVSAEDIIEATSKFDAVNRIDEEKIRIAAHLNAIKEDINRLLSELDRI